MDNETNEKVKPIVYILLYFNYQTYWNQKKII